MRLFRNSLTLFVCFIVLLSAGPVEETYDLEHLELKFICSVVDPDSIAQLVKKSYGFEPTKTKILSTSMNDIYLVEEEQNKYILRLSAVEKYLMMTRDEFQFELDWLDFLKQNEIPVSYPIPRMDGKLFGLIQAAEGPRYAALFTYANGTTKMDAENAYILGKTLAQLHLTSDQFETSLPREQMTLDSMIDNAVQKIKKHSELVDPDYLQQLDQFTADLKAKFEALDISQLNYGIIAGDVHGYNQHFTEDRQITLFDFEFCAYGYRAYDLAIFKWSRGSVRKELWNSFLDGYQSLRPLSESELASIDLFRKTRSLWWMGLMTTLNRFQAFVDRSVMNDFISDLVNESSEDSSDCTFGSFSSSSL